MEIFEEREPKRKGILWPLTVFGVCLAEQWSQIITEISLWILQAGLVYDVHMDEDILQEYGSLQEILFIYPRNQFK